MNENNTRVTGTSPLLEENKSMTSHLQSGRYSAANKQDNNVEDDESDAQTPSHHERMHMWLYTEMVYLNTKDGDQSLAVAEGIARETVRRGNTPLPIQARCHIELATLDDDSLFHAHEAVRLAELVLKGPVARDLYADAMSVLEHAKITAAGLLNQGDQKKRKVKEG